MSKRNQEKNDFYKLRESSFSDKWSTYKYLTSIQSDIKKDITSDFILAKLDQNQKESVIELVRDAYYIKKMMERYADHKTYKVNKRTGRYLTNADGTYKQHSLDPKEKKYILNMAKITFNSIMIKIIMTKIEYRNVDKNVMMELITEKDKMNGENGDLEGENREILERMKKNIKKGKEGGDQ